MLKTIILSSSLLIITNFCLGGDSTLFRREPKGRRFYINGKRANVYKFYRLRPCLPQVAMTPAGDCYLIDQKPASHKEVEAIRNIHNWRSAVSALTSDDRNPKLIANAKAWEKIVKNCEKATQAKIDSRSSDSDCRVQ